MPIISGFEILEVLQHRVASQSSACRPHPGDLECAPPFYFAELLLIFYYGEQIPIVMPASVGI